MRTRSSRSYALDEDEVAGRGLLDTIEESFYLDDGDSDLSEDEGGAGEEDVIPEETSISVHPHRKQLIVRLRIRSQNGTPTKMVLGEGKHVKVISQTKASRKSTLNGERPRLMVVLRVQRPAGQIKATLAEEAIALERIPDNIAYSVLEGLSEGKHQELASERSEEPVEASLDACLEVQDQTEQLAPVLEDLQQLVEQTKPQFEADKQDDKAFGGKETICETEIDDMIIVGTVHIQERRQSEAPVEPCCIPGVGVEDQPANHAELMETMSTVRHIEEETISLEQQTGTERKGHHGADSEPLPVAETQRHIESRPEETFYQAPVETLGHIESRPEETPIQPLKGVRSADHSSTNSSPNYEDVWSKEATPEESSESLPPTPPPEIPASHSSIHVSQVAQVSQHIKPSLPLEKATTAHQSQKRSHPLDDAPARSAKRSRPSEDTPQGENHTRKKQRREAKKKEREDDEQGEEEKEEATNASVSMQDLKEATRGTGVIAAGRAAQQRRGIVPLNDRIASGRVQKPQKPKPRKPERPGRSHTKVKGGRHH